jgi:hypothetical protein
MMQGKELARERDDIFDVAERHRPTGELSLHHTPAPNRPDISVDSPVRANRELAGSFDNRG